MGIFDYYIHTRLGMNHSSAQRTYHQAQQQSAMQNAAAYQNSLQGLANSDPYRNVAKAQSEPKQPELRTPEQIQEQIEARYAEMEAEAKRKEKAAITACSACRWGYNKWCLNPLVIGIEQEKTLDVDYSNGHDAQLCGPEKALFEPMPPKRNLWQRFVDWFLEPWMADLASTDKKA
jgi:hypothetical protein